MESFVRSMMELTRHEDAEVQFISRRFQKEYLSEIIEEERNRVDHRHWGGSDRYGGVQKRERELFRKSDERPFHNNHTDGHCHSGTDQEASKRRRISRWDEKPLERPHQSHPHYHHQSAEAPAWNDEAGPPGYNCRPSSQERVWNSDQYSRQELGSSRQQQQQQQHSTGGYMNRGRSHSHNSYSEYSTPPAPALHHQHSAPATAGPYQPLPPPPPIKYYTPPPSRPMNGCYPPPRPRGPPSSQFQHGGYGYAPIPGQVPAPGCADEEPPVPGL